MNMQNIYNNSHTVLKRRSRPNSKLLNERKMISCENSWVLKKRIHWIQVSGGFIQLRDAVHV